MTTKTIEFFKPSKNKNLSDETVEFLKSSNDFSELKIEIQKFIKENVELEKLYEEESVLTSHELQYLAKAPKDIWTDYLSFRHNFRKLASKKLTLLSHCIY